MKVKLLLENKKNPYKYHSILRSITGLKQNEDIPHIIGENEAIITEDRLKVEAFNSYFSAQTNIELTNSHHDHLESYMNTQPENRNRLESIVITTHDVLQTINRLDPSKACGPDMVQARLLKMLAVYIAEPLAKIFNKSLSIGKYPTSWKRANVKPIFKEFTKYY